jgi:hypothetical protein
MVGMEHDKVWARAWLSCGAGKLPWNAYLQTCLSLEEEGGVTTLNPKLGCGFAVIGEQHPHQLYANDEYGCVSDAIFQGWANFWLPPWHEVKTLAAPAGYKCGASDVVEKLNFTWLALEYLLDPT